MSNLFGSMGGGSLLGGNPYKEFTIYIDAGKDFRWRIKAKNGEIIGSSSEGFSSKQGCLNNLKLLGDAINSYHATEKGKP